MLRLDLNKTVFAGLLLLAPCLLPAQTILNNTPGSFMTTGIVGVTSTQTARLNVLNLQPVIPGVAAIVCPATLEFYDDSGAQLKQFAITNISPSAAASLVLKPAVPSTAVNARAQIRAVVFTPSPSPATGPMPATFVHTACNVMASLEIIDDSSGATHTVVTDLRAMPSYRATPMAGR
jgi:hypothetical protein